MSKFWWIELPDTYADERLSGIVEDTWSSWGACKLAPTYHYLFSLEKKESRKLNVRLFLFVKSGVGIWHENTAFMSSSASI